MLFSVMADFFCYFQLNAYFTKLILTPSPRDKLEFFGQISPNSAEGNLQN